MDFDVMWYNETDKQPDTNIYANQSYKEDEKKM